MSSTANNFRQRATQQAELPNQGQKMNEDLVNESTLALASIEKRGSQRSTLARTQKSGPHQDPLKLSCITLQQRPITQLQ